MYSFLLHAHNGLRLLITFLVLAIAFLVIKGFFGKEKWQKPTNIMITVYTILFDVQVLLGILLYGFFSPITKGAFQNFGAAMKNSELRFYAVEHISLMLLALVAIHLLKRLTKRNIPDQTKWKGTLIWLAIHIALVFTAIPWSRAWM